MVFHSHMASFAGYPVVDFESGSPLENLDRTIPRLRVDYDSELTGADLLVELLNDDRAEQLPGLVLGAWGPELYELGPEALIETLVAAAPQLPRLRALFLGDILSEETEVSWIVQGDLSALWSAFPQLEFFGVRGSNNLSLGRVAHGQLRQLTIECGGLPVSVIKEVLAAQLPNLEHLELYLGDDGYGFDGTVEDLAPLLEGHLFPKLRYLGLRNSIITDGIAQALAKSPLLGRIKVLDLSLGTLGDDGAAALLESPAIRQLEKLDVHHHYLSDAMSNRLRDLPITVDVSDPEDEGQYGRYCSVGE